MTWETIENATGAMSYAYGPDGPDPRISSACLREIERGSASAGPGRYAGMRVRDGMTRGDYDFYRPAEAMPRHQKEIIASCDDAYQRIGLLRNVIDLMGDFAAQGIEIFHPNKTKQRRYRHWFRKVGGKERSERFLNLLYRHGNVVVKRSYADLNLGDVEDLDRGIAGRTPAEPEDIPYERGPKVYRNRIPLRYTFLNPTAIEVVGGDLALFAGQPRYAIRLPEPLVRVIKNPKTDDDRRLVAQLPEYILAPVRAGKKTIPLDPNKVEVYHYKKDDWQHWAFPMTYSILADLKLYEKNKLADMAALDGAVSHIRLWRLGLPEHKIQPGPAAFARLREQLAAAASSGGSLDLIWDATLDFKETSTDVYNFLGMKKYEPVIQAIYSGLGIPQSLTGGKEGGGMTNHAMSLKTLIERLQYGRDLLKKFWENELNILQQAFGDRNPAQVHSENMSLSDEANEKMLWVQLVDRDIISVETLREKFGTIPDVERSRVRREYAERKEDVMPEKTGPFNEPAPNPEAAAQKAMQTGLLAPSQVPKMKTRPRKAGDKGVLDHQKDVDQQKIDLQERQMEQDRSLQEEQIKVQRQQNQDVHEQQLRHKDEEHRATLPIKKQMLRQQLRTQIRSKGRPGQGRPSGSKDKSKRKQKVVTPRTAASLMAAQMWARAAQRTIADTLTSPYLERCKKKSMRNLTAAEADAFEDLKFRVLCSLPPGSDVDVDLVRAALDDPPCPDERIGDILRSWSDHAGPDPSVEDRREMQAIAYAVAHQRGDGEADPDA